MHSHDFYTEYSAIRTRLIRGGVNYMTDHPNLKSLIIGVSGGVDSALTCYLAHEVVKKLNMSCEGRPYRLIGYCLSIDSNKEDEIQRAHNVGYAFCDEYYTCELTGTYNRLLPDIAPQAVGEDSWEARIRRGNIKARMRMMYLYDKAQMHSGMVLSTDNLTELLLGFWTLHGDVGDFGFIQNLWKTEVYGLTKHIGQYNNYGALLACVDAVPTDGLGVSNSDLDQLLPDWGGSYIEGYRKVDNILMSWIKGNKSAVNNPEESPVILRHLRTEFKRLNPVNLTRDLILNG
jgi:NAD+ synthetase